MRRQTRVPRYSQRHRGKRRLPKRVNTKENQAHAETAQRRQKENKKILSLLSQVQHLVPAMRIVSPTTYKERKEKLKKLEEEARLIDRLAEELKCGLCHDIVRNPVQLNCGHSICALCKSRLFRLAVPQNGNKKCPLCNTVISGSSKNFMAKNLAEKLIETRPDLAAADALEEGEEREEAPVQRDPMDLAMEHGRGAPAAVREVFGLEELRQFVAQDEFQLIHHPPDGQAVAFWIGRHAEDARHPVVDQPGPLRPQAVQPAHQFGARFGAPGQEFALQQPARPPFPADIPNFAGRRNPGPPAPHPPHQGQNPWEQPQNQNRPANLAPPVIPAVFPAAPEVNLPPEDEELIGDLNDHINEAVAGERRAAEDLRHYQEMINVYQQLRRGLNVPLPQQGPVYHEYHQYMLQYPAQPVVPGQIPPAGHPNPGPPDAPQNFPAYHGQNPWVEHQPQHQNPPQNVQQRQLTQYEIYHINHAVDHLERHLNNQLNHRRNQELVLQADVQAAQNNFHLNLLQFHLLFQIRRNLRNLKNNRQELIPLLEANPQLRQEGFLGYVALLSRYIGIQMPEMANLPDVRNPAPPAFNYPPYRG